MLFIGWGINSIKFKTDPSLSDSRVFQIPSLSISTAESCHKLFCTMTKTRTKRLSYQKAGEDVTPCRTRKHTALLICSLCRPGSVPRTALTLVTLTIKFVLNTRLPLRFVWQPQFSICGEELWWGWKDVWNRLHPWAMTAPESRCFDVSWPEWVQGYQTILTQ